MKSTPQETQNYRFDYEIRVAGHLGAQWADWFDGLTIKLEEDGKTLLSGTVSDQAALYGVLKKIRDMGMPLISVNRNQTKKELLKMNVFVVGSTGATGKKLASELLERGHRVVTVARSAESLPEELRNHPNMAVTEASLLNLSNAELQVLVQGCDAIVSTLGHNASFKGMYGHPRRLVADAARRLCDAAKANHPQNPVKFVLMNTTGNRNRDLDEKQAFGEKVVIGLLRVLLPPQADNEAAANYLRTQIGQNDTAIEWVAVRPDGLINEDTVTEYTIHPSPTRSPISNPGQTSRINVGHFMAELIDNDALWQAWKGQMPVIYNKVQNK